MKDFDAASDDAEFLRIARERYEESETAEYDNRLLALDDLRCLNGEQWPDAIRKEREADSRPCLTLNRLPGFVDQVVGDQRQNRPRIKVRPVDDKSDPEIAKILEGLIRNIEYTSHADSAYDTAFENAANNGFGYFRILKEYAGKDTFEQDLLIRRIKNPFSVRFDPNAQEADKSDAEWCFVEEVIRKKEFERRFPKATWPSEWETSSTGSAYTGWFMTDKVRIAEYFIRASVEKAIVQLGSGAVMTKDDYNDMVRQANIQMPSLLSDLVPSQHPDIPPPFKIVKERMSKSFEVKQYIISGSEVLEGPKKWDSEYIPIIPVLGKELVVDGKSILRGVVRNAKDPQRMYNYWRSAITEVVALAPKSPYMATPEQIEGHETLWSSAHRKSLPYLLYNNTGAPMPQRQVPGTIPQGAFTEAQAAVDDMKATTGIYDASLGSRSNETSGKAIIARQREGDVATFVFIDNLSRAIQHAGRILVEMIPKVYDTERIIRIMNIDGTDKSIPINKTGIDRSGMPVILNDITVGKYDVVVEAGPSYTTQRQDAAESILGFMQATPSQAPLMADLAAKNMDWPDAQEISARLKKTLPPGLAEPEEGEQPPQPQPNPQVEMEQAKMQMEEKKMQMDMAIGQQKMQLELRKMQMEEQKMQAEIELEKEKMALEKYKIEGEIVKERLRHAGAASGD